MDNTIMKASADITTEVLGVELSRVADKIVSMKESMVAKILCDNLQQRYSDELTNENTATIVEFAKNHNLEQISDPAYPDELIYSVDGKKILSIEDCSSFGGINGKCFIQYNVKSLDGKQVVYREESGEKNDDMELLQMPVE